METWNWIFLLISVASLGISAWVLYRQEFGRAELTGILGPKFYIYHDSVRSNQAQYARVILPVTFINESPRGGCILKMALCLSTTKCSQKHILGWLYEAEIEQKDLENPNSTFRKMPSGNPFFIEAKSTVTKNLYFEANTDEYKNDESKSIQGMIITRGEWQFSLLIWNRETELHNFSITGTANFSDYDAGVLTTQTISTSTSTNIFYFANRSTPYATTKSDLRQYLRRLNR